MGKGNFTDALSKRMNAAQDGYDPISDAYDNMFGLSKVAEGGKRIVKLDISLIKPHPHDPFKPYTEDKLRELAESIARVGLLDPINVRPDENGGYEILTGKNRTNAVRLNGGEEIDAIITDADDDTAIMIITDSNLRHREKLLPSEKAFAYKLQLEAVKRQGKRSDLAGNGTSTQIAWKLESANIIAEHNEVSRDEVRRHIRLTSLIPELLEAVDSEDIPFMAGVDISFLDEPAQKEVYNYFCAQEEAKLDLKTSALIKKIFNEGKMTITAEVLSKILNKPQNKRIKPFSINRNRFKEFADKLPDDKELERLFLEFLQEKFAV